MVLPLAIPLAVAVAAGVGAAGKGMTDIARARSLAKDARARHEATLAALKAAQAPVHDLVAEYGIQQLAAVTETVGRFADWIEHNQMSVNRLGHRSVEGVEVSVSELPSMRSQVKQARGWITGGVAGASAAAAAPSVALMGVSAFATASTGTAIAGLSGAAATNATLAWLGGGALAAGGGGIAAGAVVLNLIAVAPAALIGGITVAVIGSKQRTSARQYTAEVNVAIENINSAISLLPRVAERVTELSSILKALAVRADEAIGALEELSFDPDLHAADFAKALQLIRAIREVVNTALIDAQTGEPTAVSLQIVRKYE